MRQRRLRIGEAVDGLVGIFVASSSSEKVSCIAQAQRFLDRLRRVAEQPRHFLRGFEKTLGIGGEPVARRGR